MASRDISSNNVSFVTNQIKFVASVSVYVHVCEWMSMYDVWVSVCVYMWVYVCELCRDFEEEERSGFLRDFGRDFNLV